MAQTPQQDGTPDKLAIYASKALSFLRIKGVDMITEAGYRRAWDLSVDVLDRRINKLHERVRSGSSLTKQEQLVLTTLTEVRDEINDELNQMRGKRDSDVPGGQADRI